MPDFTQYKTDVPYTRPELPKNGLSLIVKPIYDYVNTFPDSVDFGDAGKSAFDYLNFGEKNPFAHLGVVPTAPAVSTPYNISRRFNDSDMMFLPTRDNEDLYAKNQGFFHSVGNGLGRLVLTTGTKLGTGIGYLAGLMGLGNNYEDYKPGFAGWIAGAADNGLKKWFENSEDQTIKQDWLPLYQEASDRDKGFFRRAATDLNFWTEDVADGAAFMASAFVPGMAISKLGAGTAFLRNAALLRGLTFATEEGALSAEGLSGGVESANALTKGATTAANEGKGLTAFTTPGTPEAPGTLNILPEVGAGPGIKATADGLPELPRVFKWIDNAKLARSIDVGATTIINTASESMFEADGVKKDLIEKLSSLKDNNGNYLYTPDQVRNIAAKAAKDTFLMNLGALSMSNLWEANLMFKKLASRAESGAVDAITKGLWDDAKLQKKAFGKKVWEKTEKAFEGVAVEGLWEENIQLAIQRLNESNENFDLDFGDKLGKLAPEYFGQTMSAVTGNDTEAVMNIGVGGLMGAIMPGITKKIAGALGFKEKTEKDRIANLNSQVSFFKTLGNIYETDDNGKILLNERNSPTVDVNKLKSYVASLNKVLNLQELVKNFDGRGLKELAQLYKDEIFARYVKAHFDNGLGELLHKRLDDIKNITPEDMALLGFDPDSKNSTVSQSIEDYKKRATELENLYDNIQRNYIPFRKDKKGEKFYAITDKLFYMSARIQSLAKLINNTKQNYDSLKGNVNQYDALYNHTSDAVIDEYNRKFEALEAAKRQTSIAYAQQEATLAATQPVNETRKGVTVTAPSKLERLQKQNPSVAISLPTNQVEENEQTIKDRQQQLDQYVIDNKETLEQMKKDSRGRYLYEIKNKNILPSAKEMQRLQIIQSELELAHENTLRVMSHLADQTYGEKYYDQVYAPALKRQALSLQSEPLTDQDTIATEQENLAPKQKPVETVLNDDQIEKAYDQAVENGTVDNDKKDVVDHLVNKISKGEKLNEKEETIRQVVKDDVEQNLRKKKEEQTLNDVFDKQSELNREKDALEAIEHRTDEQNQRLDEIYNQLDALDEVKQDKFDEFDNEMTVRNSNNIKSTDKEKYEEILNDISKNKKRVVKYDDYYEVDGVRYSKVTDIIGDVIPTDVRSKVQNAITAGYTIDNIVKTILDNKDDDAFRNSMADKISDESYDKVIKQIRAIRDDLRAKGIEIVGTNVVIFDEERKVAGEIDLLGVDKHGNFKIYEIQARRQEVYKMYGLRGRGIKIRELDQQRLSAYRNMFANQYGAVPNEISVMFPFQVKYDKESANGYIDSVDSKKAIRFTPSRSVQIKRKVFEPIRIGSKFDNIDILKIYANTFLTDEELKGKVAFLMRNVPLAEIKKKITITVKNAAQNFQERFAKQKELLDGKPTDYKLTKYPGFDNLYALAGNKEITVNHENTLLGYMSPSKSLAYKDTEGNYHMLDENIDVKTYIEVTGNSEQTYPEFKRISQAYTFAYGKLVEMLEKSGKDELTLTNDEVQSLYDTSLSYGELDKVPVGEERPYLSDLTMSGVRIGKKQVVTVVHVDVNDNIQVMMDKTNKTKNTITKYQDVDRWVNNNLPDVTKTLENKDGKRVTEYAGIIELPNGEFRVIPLKKTAKSKLENNEEFVPNLGNEFTAAVRKNVFKNEGVSMIPKYKEEMITFDLKDAEIAKKVYPAEEIESLEKFGLNPADGQPEKHHEIVDNFITKLSDENIITLAKLVNLEVAQSAITKGNLASEKTLRDILRFKIMDEYQNSLGFSSLQDYLEYITECKL